LRALRKDGAGDEIVDLQIEALLGRERAFRELGKLADQGADLAELAELAEGDDELLAEVFSRRAELLVRRGDLDEAVEVAKSSVAAAARTKAPLIEGEALRILGEAYERRGEFDKGLELTTRALSIFERLGDREHETLARISMARNHLTRSHYAEARGIYQPILDEIRRNRDPWVERLANNHLAAIHLCLGEFDDALVCAERSLHLCQLDGDMARRGDNLSVSALILSEVGQFEEADARFTEALACHDATESRWSRADTLIYAATNDSLRGDFERAIQRAHEALQEAQEIDSPYIEANAGVALAGIYLLRDEPGDAARARAVAANAAEVARAATLSGAQAMALSRQAEALRRLGGAHSALPISLSAMKILDRQRHLEGSEEEILFHHYCLLAETDAEDADVALERVVRSFERKLQGIESREWRRSFTEELPLHQAILTAHDEAHAH
jgi:tetratricopeptide (TPR) repeat protein